MPWALPEWQDLADAQDAHPLQCGCDSLQAQPEVQYPASIDLDGH